MLFGETDIKRSRGRDKELVQGTLLFHVRMLIQDIDPQLDDDVVARLILGAFAPAITYDCRRLGITDTTIEASALALLRGIT